MTTEITIRAAAPEEYPWINARYDEVKFVHSIAGRDCVMIAQVANQPAGLGRLVPLSADAAELGGMYVFDAFRGMGVAHKLVDALLQAAGQCDTVYCLPFAHLQAFYRQHGFADVIDTASVPRQVLEKHGWCTAFYTDRATLLLARNRTGIVTSDERLV